MESSPTKAHTWLQTFASLGWYEQTIRFIFNFITKTSELLLAAGIVVSTANFLTDGDVMRHHTAVSDAWSWAQAIAIDSSLGMTCMNALQAVREREKIKAVIFCVLTLLLATVAGLITHFDALAHAAGLPVTDQGVSGIIPLWVMTALRAIAVIGFLLASRIKEVSFTALGTAVSKTDRSISTPESNPSLPTVSAPAPSVLDYQALATAMLTAMQEADVLPRVRISEDPIPSTPKGLQQGTRAEQETHVERTEITRPPGNPHSPESTSLPMLAAGNQPLMPPELEVMERDQKQSGTASGDPCICEQEHGNQDQIQQEPDETITSETEVSNCSGEGDPNGDQTRIACFMVGECYRRERLLAVIRSRPSGLLPTQLETSEPFPGPEEEARGPAHQAIQETISVALGLAEHDPETQERDPQAPNSDHQDGSSESVDERLRHAYLALQREGLRITGESLRRRASIRTQTARAWLREEKARLHSY